MSCVVVIPPPQRSFTGSCVVSLNNLDLRILKFAMPSTYVRVEKVAAPQMCRFGRLRMKSVNVASKSSSRRFVYICRQLIYVVGG